MPLPKVVLVKLAKSEDPREYSFNDGTVSQAAANQDVIDRVVKEIAALALQAVSEEEEFEGEMSKELSDLLTSKEAVTAAMRAAVVLTKQGITERIQGKLKELGIDVKLV